MTWSFFKGTQSSLVFGILQLSLIHTFLGASSSPQITGVRK